MWELEGRGVKSHMQCVPHAALVDSMPTIRLTLQAPGVEKKVSEDVIHHRVRVSECEAMFLYPRQSSKYQRLICSVTFAQK